MEGRVVAITGGASGIGLATAKLLASRGAKLSLADISEENLEAAKKEIGGDDVLVCKCDVRDLSQVQDWLKKTVEKYGQLDGGVNLAGTIGKNYGTYMMEDEDEENWDLIIGVNVTGVMHSIKAEIKHMKAGGSIVNAASIAGLRGVPYMGAYCASKHAVIGLTKSAAREVGSRGIRVNAIAPGWIHTPMTKLAEQAPALPNGEAAAQITALGRGGEPKEVACLIAFLLSDDASYMTGAVYEVDAGFST